MANVNVNDSVELRNEAQARLNYIATARNAGYDVANQQPIVDAAHQMFGSVIPDADPDTVEVIAQSLEEETKRETDDWLSRWFG